MTHTNDVRACAHLELCPFCGGDGQCFEVGRGRFVVICQECESEGPPSAGFEGAHTLWNGRAWAWRPISSAPLDGMPLLLLARAKNASASAIVIGWYLRDIGWIEAAFVPNHPVGLVPSHWMPLPAFPILPPQKSEFA